MTVATAIHIIDIDAQVEWLLTFGNEFITDIEELKQLKITIYDTQTIPTHNH